MASMAKWGPKTWDVSPRKIMTLEGLSFSYTQTADSTSSSDATLFFMSFFMFFLPFAHTYFFSFWVLPDLGGGL